MSETSLRSARLFGRDYHELGDLAAVAEGDAAITLSRGGARKTYSHTEPNEDAALFARGSGGTLVAVADGHHGALGAQTVIAHLLAEWAPRWTDSDPIARSDTDWTREALRALASANHALLADAALRGRAPAPTTLAIGLARKDENSILWAGIGDSHVFAVKVREARDLLRVESAPQRTCFLGYESLDPESLATRCSSGRMAREDLLALVLATDGLSETEIGVADPAGAVHAATVACNSIPPELRPLELARGVSHAALQAHRQNAAGDNIASAVIWLSP